MPSFDGFLSSKLKVYNYLLNVKKNSLLVYSESTTIHKAPKIGTLILKFTTRTHKLTKFTTRTRKIAIFTTQICNFIGNKSVFYSIMTKYDQILSEITMKNDLFVSSCRKFYNFASSCRKFCKKNRKVRVRVVNYKR